MDLDWKISSFCPAGACVAVADTPDGGVAVRSTREPERVLRFTREEWSAFVAGVKADEFG